MLNMQDLLISFFDKKASDLHLVAGLPPMFRIDGEVQPTHYDVLSAEVCQKLIYSILNEEQKERFETKNELDMSIGIQAKGRVRINVFRQRGVVGAALRAIPQKIFSFEELNLPPVVHEIMKLNKGLVLVTGATGSGKTTTLASMINFLNENRTSHIITIEDPIEYVHSHKKCIINQREVGSDTFSFPTALKYVLRQDPDIILIGEMRDLETISAALTIAETGHLVFATLHTTDAASSINRMIDVFPPHQQAQIRSQLSLVLQAVFSQQLLPHISGTGRILACEILIVNPAIRNLIREMKVEQIYLAMQTGSKFGMQTMNQVLCDLYARQKISYETVLSSTNDADDVKRILQNNQK
ncbi:MAG: type IV pilus twitching motility protein PilT [Elusimicrobia bacterium]|nr:type IV pilus twitching motility protein PilT [Elusimicrobiota bacterium]